MNALDDWNNLKEVTKLAVGQLLDQLQSETSTQDLLDSYLYAKRLLAESMQAFIRVDLTESSETFNDLREQIRAAIDRRYAGRIPDRYLKVPYGSRVHEELFAILLQRQGIPVQAALLRVVTGELCPHRAPCPRTSRAGAGRPDLQGERLRLLHPRQPQRRYELRPCDSCKSHQA